MRTRAARSMMMEFKTRVRMRESIFHTICQRWFEGADDPRTIAPVVGFIVVAKWPRCRLRRGRVQMSGPRHLEGSGSSVSVMRSGRSRSRLELVELLAKVVDAVAQICNLVIDLGPPALELGLRGGKLGHRVVNLAKAMVVLGNRLRLRIKLGENQRELIFNLHRHLQAGTVLVSQYVQLPKSIC